MYLTGLYFTGTAQAQVLLELKTKRKEKDKQRNPPKEKVEHSLGPAIRFQQPLLRGKEKANRKALYRIHHAHLHWRAYIGLVWLPTAHRTLFHTHPILLGSECDAKP